MIQNEPKPKVRRDLPAGPAPSPRPCAGASRGTSGAPRRRGRRGDAVRWLVLGWLCAVTTLACDGDSEPAAPAEVVRVEQGIARVARTRDANAMAEASAAAERFEHGDDLQVSVFATEPFVQNPVAFDIDDDGKVYVAETHRYRESVFDITLDPQWLSDDIALQSVDERRAFLLRTFADDPDRLTRDSEIVRVLCDDDGDHVADRAAVFADDFREPESGPAAGILAHACTVFLACIPDLWALEMADDDELRAAARERLHTGFGVHIGVSGHDLHGLALGPDGRLYFSLGDRGARLTTLDGRDIDLRETGGVLRCELDGSGLEVFATGLRNPQELTFDAAGHLWTVDNDTAGGDKARVIHVVRGGDYGWRFSYQHMPGFGPWVGESVWSGGGGGGLPNAGYVAQGPSGLTTVPGASLGVRYLGAMLVCDFPGGVHAFWTEAAGASMRVQRSERLLWGLWPTDVAFAPDGALLVSDWVAGWGLPDRGRLYRLRSNAQSACPAAASAAAELARGDWDSRPALELAALLGHADLRVRQRAHLEFARRGARELGLLRDVVERAADDEFAARHALWALGRIASEAPDAVAPIVAALDCDDPEVRRIAAETLGELRVAGAADQLIAALDDPSPHVVFAAAIAIGQLGSPRGLAPIVQMLARNARADAYLEHAGVMALVGICRGAAGDGPPEGALLEPHADTPNVRNAVLLAWRRLGDARIARFLRVEEEPRLVTEAARAIYDAPIAAALPSLAARFGDPALEPAARRRALHALVRVGGDSAPADIARVAMNLDLPADLLREAIASLTTWSTPPPIDPVLGLFRPIEVSIARRQSGAESALASLAHRWLQPSSDTEVLLELLRGVARMRLFENEGRLGELFAAPEVDVRVRVAALDTLAELGATSFADIVVDAASPDSDLAIRRAALPHLVRVDTERAAPLALQIVDDTAAPIELRRAALHALARLGHVPRATRDALRASLTKLAQRQFEPALMFELLEACLAAGDADLADAAAAFRKVAGPSGLDSFADVLEGGDAALGRAVFAEHAGVACQRCHIVAGLGGTVGPALDGIGARESRFSLLQSIVRPAAQLTPGYPAAMPPGLEQLMTRTELRDLIAYLASLR